RFPSEGIPGMGFHKFTNGLEKRSGRILRECSLPGCVLRECCMREPRLRKTAQSRAEEQGQQDVQGGIRKALHQRDFALQRYSEIIHVTEMDLGLPEIE